MIAQTGRRFVLIGLMLLFAVPSRSDFVTSNMVAVDPRLNSAVSVNSARIRISEVLQRLSHQSGVPLSIDDRTSASGISLVAVVSKVPLFHAMNALASLVSRKSYPWHWIRSESNHQVGYLLKPADLDDMAATERRKTQMSFEREAAFLMRASRLSPEERKKLKGDNPADDYLLTDNRVLSGNKIFAEAVSPEQQSAILRGQQMLAIPISQLPTDAQAYIQSELDLAITSRPVSPGKIVFHVERGAEDMCSTMYMQIEGIGGHGYVGGSPLNNLLRDDVKADWLMPGDATKDPQTSHQVAEPDNGNRKQETTGLSLASDANKQSQPFAGNTEEQRLLQFAQGGAISMLAITGATPQSQGPLYGKTVAEHLKELSNGRWHMMNKWRDGILLLNYPPWFMEANEYAPYANIVALRKALGKSPVFLDLRALATATGELNKQQLDRLKDEFAFIDVIEAMHDAFVLMTSFPEINQPAGGRLRDEMMPYIQKYFDINTITTHRAVALRIRKVITSKVDPVRVEIFLELLNEKGKVCYGIGARLQ